MVGLLHQRLLKAASLPQNELILECYHPISKLTTLYLYCRHLGLKTRDGPIDSESPRFADLRRLYSSFRPVAAEDDRPRPWWEDGPTGQVEASAADKPEVNATLDVSLDEGELFSQLCCVSSIVKEGPRRGLFTSHVNMFDGVIRVWRDWLAKMASDNAPGGESEQFQTGDERILWVDSEKTIGVRFRVHLGPAERMPLISGPGDELPVSYSLVYEGKKSDRHAANHLLTGAELLVRTSKLLLAVEKSETQKLSTSGKAIVIASR